MRRRLAALLLPALLAGCVGISFHGSRRTADEPLSTVVPWLVAGTTQPADASRLLERLGEPEERKPQPDGGERWVYRGDFRWGGVALWLLLPLPLVVPIGRESQAFLVRDGTVISVDRVRQASTWHLCGIIPGPCASFGCATLRE